MNLSQSSSFSDPSGNCQDSFDPGRVRCESSCKEFRIFSSKNAMTKISEKKIETSSIGRGYTFVLMRPKDDQVRYRHYIQEVLRIYEEELPAMNYAANTGKKSKFLHRCVTSGKYSTLLLKSKSSSCSEEVIAAITYQIVPTDTRYAEIPLAAVRSSYQHKGSGGLLFSELGNRLHNVGIETIYCWGDEESKGFWLKQGFSCIAKIDCQGRSRRLPISANIRKALCYPGGSTLMVSHLSIEAHQKNESDVIVHDSDYLSGVKRVWDTTLSSINTKRVKGSHQVFPDKNYEENQEKSYDISPPKETVIAPSNQNFRILLMNIVDNDKKRQITKVIETLGGHVTTDGSTCTHVVTGKIRATLNFCSALSQGAWIVSPSWLKESFRMKRFADEEDYILQANEYMMRFGIGLKDAILKGKANPGALFKGYSICLAKQVHPPIKTLAAIIRCTGGKVVSRLENVETSWKFIYIACEDDMEEALSAARQGVLTFSSEWLINCVLSQEVDLQAQKFTESLS